MAEEKTTQANEAEENKEENLQDVEAQDAEIVNETEAAETVEQEDTSEPEETETAEDGAGEEAQNEENAEDTESSDGKEKESIFGKLKGKSKKQEEEIANLTDRLKRSMAEFENFRKRTEREKSQMYEIGAGDVIGKLLPVVDSFERGLAAVPEENREDPVYSGMELIYKQMMTALTEIGVTPIEAVGQPFDPNFHNAVMHIEDDELPENVVAEEFQKGYKYRDNIIRHSMVKVAN